MLENALVLLTAIGLVGALCQWAAWWLKLPAIVLLLGAGLLAGPVTGVLDPDALFGDLLFPIVSLGVAIVLFEGSLTLRFDEIRETAGVVRNLITVGALVNWTAIALAASWLLELPWVMALLFGAVVVVTGPTVIMPLLRTMRPNANIANVLRWEGIIIDPLGALLAVLVFEVIVSGQQHNTLQTFALMALVGVALGMAGAWALATVLRRHLLPGYLINVASLAWVLTIFTGANELEHESGLLAVTIMGMALANMRDVPIEEVLDFKESLSVMFISGLFIILAARLDAGDIQALGWGAVALLAVVLFVARPAAVFVSTAGSSLNWRERALLGWIAPRGIVAAAVAALFSLRLEELGVAGAELLVPLTFMVIIGTVVLQSATARPLAGWLRVSEPEPKGVLIIGAHRTARAIATALQESGFRVVLTDTTWANIRRARMDGLATYFGNPVSDHADRNLDLVGVGRLLAMSRRPALNALACVRFKSEFGAGNVYSVQMPEEKDAPEKKSAAGRFTCPRLFGEEVTLPMLSSMVSKGAEVHTTKLTENYDFDAYIRQYRHKVIPLFALTPRGHLRPFTAGTPLHPEPGWSVIGLLPEKIVTQMHKEAAHEKLEEED